jgi:hypothetical protein
LDSEVEQELELPILPQKSFKKFEDCTGEFYLKPISKSFACIDSLIPSKALFQMTVSETHSIKMNKMKMIVKKCGLLPLYFVVPSSLFKEFKMQSFCTVGGKVAKTIPPDLGDLKQWALCIDESTVRDNDT